MTNGGLGSIGGLVGATAAIGIGLATIGVTIGAIGNVGRQINLVGSQRRAVRRRVVRRVRRRVATGRRLRSGFPDLMR